MKRKTIKTVLLSVILLISGKYSIQARIMLSVPGDSLSFEITSSTYSSLEIQKDSSVVFGPMTIKNNGDEDFDMNLSVSHDSPWSIGEHNGSETISFFGIFASTVPVLSDFNTDDLILTQAKTAGADNFARQQDSDNIKGFNVESSSSRNCYFRMDSPTDTIYIDTEYSFVVNLTVFSAVTGSTTIGSSGGTVEINNRITLVVPAGALKDSTQFTITSMNPDSQPKGNNIAKNITAICSYAITPAGTVFRKPCEISINYSNEDVPAGEENNLGIFFWDGFEWRFAGSRQDVSGSIVTAYISHLTTFALFPVGSTPVYIPAERIITPATVDGKNDIANFDGVAGKDIKIEILDVTGRKIRTIDVMSEGNVWNGRDDSGSIVESGMYIYQFEVDNKSYSGIIAVAK